jgi:hypothetical protein
MTTSERFWPTPRVEPGNVSKVKGKLYETSLQSMARKGLLTSSPEDSPASPSAPQASAKANPMTAISGRNLRELFDVPDRVGAFLKTCRESSVWKVGLTGYSLTWVRAATPQGRSLFRLRLSAPTTAATASGLWPTPNSLPASNDTSLTCSGDGREKPNKLGWAVQERMLPTPTQDDANNVMRESGEFQSLTRAVMFQSPMPSDVDGGRTTKGRKRQNETGIRKQAMWPAPRYEGFDAGAHRGEPDSLHSAVKMIGTPTSAMKHRSPEHAEGRSLNPKELANASPGMKLSAAWVGRLMGYPDGWMHLDGKPLFVRRVQSNRHGIEKFSDGLFYKVRPGTASGNSLNRAFRLPHRLRLDRIGKKASPASRSTKTTA